MASRTGVSARHFQPRALGVAVPLLLATAGGCTPSVPVDPIPEEMDYDLESMPPRAPQPTNLVVSPLTGHINFAQAGIVIPADCTTSTTLSPAECEFDQYLQRLDGFPTVTPAAAPASAALDPATLTPGTNIVVINATTGVPVPDAKVGFDPITNQVIVKPARSWAIGSTYWIGVRGYGNGVRAAGGKEVVGSPTHALFKQETSLTCGAMPPSDVIPPTCPGLKLISQNKPDPAAAMSALFQLEPIRQLYNGSGAFTLMAAAGLPKEELAVLWGFPIHSASVAELDPTVGLVPRVTAPNEIRVAVQGTVAPASLKAFVLKQSAGTVVLMDLTAAAAGDLVAGFPVTQATYAAGDIVLTGAAPFAPGHQFGVFITSGVTDLAGAPLVPSPVSVLLTLRGTLLSATGHSTISTVADSDAVMLEAGRMQLGALFDDAIFGQLTGVMRSNLVYCFAFALGATP